MDLKSNNPAFNADTYRQFEHDFATPRAMTMTVQGSISKTFLLLAILSAGAIWSWTQASQGQMSQGLLIGSAIAGAVVALVTIFKPTVAPWTAPVYAALEGVFLGALSLFIEKRYYPGIAMQAVALTSCTLFVMLVLYGTRTIKVTDKLRGGIMAATGALCMVYLIIMALNLFGMHVAFPRGGLGVGISLFIVGLAAFNLLLDFDMIEQGAAAGAPKSMEWYGAFGLIVTLVWLYLEVLRLLRNISDSRR